MRIGIGLPGLILLMAITAVAQFSGSNSNDARRSVGDRGVVVRGQISSVGTLATSLTVELLTNGHSISGSTLVALDGSFEFPSVVPGTYELRVIGASGAIAHQQRVFINGPEQNLAINIPGQPNTVTNGGGTVSIRQLQHKVPSEASKEFSRGMAASKKGDEQRAVDHFQKAVSIDPEFADAHNNLGAAYAALGQLEPATEQFQKAIDLVPDHSLALSNLGIVLCRLEHYPEAEQVARRALRLDSGLLKMRYILAVSLIARHGDNTEALENLERAAAEVPNAHLLAADILSQAGRRDDAAKQLEQYLSSVSEHDMERPRLEAWLAQLRQP